MHYFIDGYNLLFRLLHGSEDLQSEREAIIYDLNKKISLIKLDVAIVFDAAFQIGGRSRSHYDSLEILFTGEGESADEYLIDEIQNSPSPRQETVVTSDKKLARQIRNCSGNTESVEDFILWLNRSYKNKLRQMKKGGPLPAAPAPQAPQAKPKSSIPPKDAPLEAYQEYYARLFEAEWQEIQKKEQMAKESRTSSKPPPRKPRKKKDPFQPPLSPEERQASEMERWLKLFEKRE